MSGSSIGLRVPFKLFGASLSRLYAAIAGLTIITLIGAVGFFVWNKTPPTVHLKDPTSANASALLSHWRNGDVVVMVRHAERCDRSDHTCLGPEDGITRNGSSASVLLGQSFGQLGLEHTDVLSSPITRTVQTAQYMFDKPAVTAQWLADCGAAMRSDLIAHKEAKRNLILVTHSGCISDFEKQSGFKHAPAAQYNSSLFVLVTGDGSAKILGVSNMADWPAVSAAVR
jgi:phosphohistidine phosphatase SixA